MEEKYFFSTVIDDYIVGRASYPDELFSAIRDFSGIENHSRLLEVGAGPGTATDAFVDYNLDLLEISEEQVQFLKNKYKNYNNICVKKGLFEDYKPEFPYDLLYSATAFHWIDPEISYSKAAKCLKKGGTLAVFWNMTFDPKANLSEFGVLQQIVRKYCPGFFGDKEENYADSQKLRWMQYIYKTGCFSNPICKDVRWTEKYDADRFISCLKTIQSTYFENLSSTDLICEITKFFDGAGGTVEIPCVAFLILAKKIADETENYEFVPSDKLAAVIEISELGKYPNIVETHFLNYADEVLYVVDDDVLYGIITPRDVIRYYNGQRKSKINRNFRCLREVDYKGAKMIFEEIPNIHEVAVVENGKLLGIIFSGKKKMPTEWKKIREDIQKVFSQNTRLSLADLFKSMTQAEQKKLLETKFDSYYVELFETDYDSRTF